MAAVPDYSEQRGIRNDARRMWVWYDDDGNVHRDNDEPAVIADSGNRYWLRHGKSHRDNGPAMVSAGKMRVWMKNGKPHRLDGPAIEDPDREFKMWKGFVTASWYVDGTAFPNGDDDEYKEACYAYRCEHEGKLTKGTLGSQP